MSVVNEAVAVADWALLLAIYSFVGWVAEVLYVLAKVQRLENRGFLTGPFLPIYGIGALGILAAVDRFSANAFVVFLASVALTTALEYLTHLALDRVFHIRLWDYSAMPFNLQGRVCLQNSLLFGVLALFLVYVLHPVVSTWLLSWPAVLAVVVASVLAGVLLVDATSAILSLARVRPVLDHLRSSLTDAHARIEADARAATAAHDRWVRASRLRLASIERLTRVFPAARSTR